MATGLMQGVGVDLTTPLSRLRSRIAPRISWRVAVPAALLAAVAAPILLSDYYLYVVTAGMVISLGLFGLVILVGGLGEVSLAQATFMGLGAFGAARFSSLYQFGLLENIAALALITVPIAAVLAIPALHVRASLLAITTLAIAVAADAYIFKQDNALLGGGGSTSLAINRPDLFGIDLASDTRFYGLVVVMVAVGAFVLQAILRSEFGRRVRAVRDSEVVAASRGIDVRWTRLSAFILSSVFATIAGVLFAYHQTAVNAISFDAFHGATLAVLAVLSGGTALGALGVGVAYSLLPAMFRNVSLLSSEYVPALFGAAVIMALRLQARREERLPLAAGVRDTPSRVPSTARVFDDGDLVVRTEALANRPGTLEISGLSKRFGGVRALQDVTLTAGPDQGDIVGLIGPNGCGKTTLFNCISGVLPPDCGRVLLDGVDLTSWPAHWRARYGLSRSFQGVKLFDSMDVRSNLLVVSASVRDQFPHERPEDRVDAAVQLLGIGGLLQATPASLPLGLRRRVDLAAALCCVPRILLLDEPASGMDVTESSEFAEVLRLVAASGVRILLVEHDMDLMLDVADYLYVLEFGRLLAEGRPADVRTDPKVIEAYLGTLGVVKSGVGS